MTAVRWALCLAALLLPVGSASAASFCDPSLEKGEDSPLSYQMRGDRCEGIYAQQVSAVSVETRSLVAGFGPFNPNQDEELELAWTAPPGSIQDVRLRAFSFRERLYYRMDTRVPAVKGVYHWDSALLASQKLGREDLGVIAWVDLPGPGGSTRQVYLPLRAAGGTPRAADGYEISLYPSAKLSQVHVTVSQVDGKGNTLTTVRRAEELGYGYYPSGEPTAFFTGKLGPAGFYRVEILALPERGDSLQQALELYHSGD